MSILSPPNFLVSSNISLIFSKDSSFISVLPESNAQCTHRKLHLFVIFKYNLSSIQYTMLGFRVCFIFQVSDVKDLNNANVFLCLAIKNNEIFRSTLLTMYLVKSFGWIFDNISCGFRLFLCPM